MNCIASASSTATAALSTGILCATTATAGASGSASLRTIQFIAANATTRSSATVTPWGDFAVRASSKATIAILNVKLSYQYISNWSGKPPKGEEWATDDSQLPGFWPWGQDWWPPT